MGQGSMKSSTALGARFEKGTSVVVENLHGACKVPRLALKQAGKYLFLAGRPSEK